MVTVIIEWIGLDCGSPCFSDDPYALFLEFEDWTGPLPRVGENIMPPSLDGKSIGRDYGDYEWVVSSISWEFNTDPTLEAIRIVVHEYECGTKTAPTT
jgi:hypothetical protein